MKTGLGAGRSSLERMKEREAVSGIYKHADMVLEESRSIHLPCAIVVAQKRLRRNVQ